MTHLYLERARQVGKTTAGKCSLIAFTGKPGAGKDSAAAVLVNHCRFRSIAFADALRREISAAWRIDERMLTHRPTKELPIPALAVGMCGDPAFIIWCVDAGESLHAPRSPRWVLQQWATFQRRWRPNCYADIVARWIRREAALGFQRFAITDLRDPVELHALLALGMPLRVVRVHSRAASTLAPDTAVHISERHHIPGDLDLCNDGSLQALAEAVLQLPPVAALRAADATA
jgi:hypothetical protein